MPQARCGSRSSRAYRANGAPRCSQSARPRARFRAERLGEQCLARQLPAAWQESIKQGRKWRYERFLRRAQNGRTWFARSFDLPAVLGTWGMHVPPEHIHLVTVPQRATPGDGLWERFCRATGIDPTWGPVESSRSNASLGVAETAVLRQLNVRLDRETRREKAYDHLIRQMLAEEELVRGDSPRITLPPDHYDWVEERTRQFSRSLGTSR